MSLYDTLVETSAKDIGYKEGKNNDSKYGVWYGFNHQPWCMYAVQYWHNAIGSKLPVKTGSCSALLSWYRKNRPNYIYNAPQKGFVCLYNFGHTGIVESWTSTTVTCIEGNTSAGTSGSQVNGDGVYRRTRSRNLVTAYVDGIGAITERKGGKDLDIVKGSTNSEISMIKAIQTAVGAVADGEIGTQTMSDIARLVGAKCFPLTLKIYNAPVIIAQNIVPFEGNGNTLAGYGNVINGSFYAGGKPCSILIQDGKVKQKNACHASYGKPESVLYRLWSGETGIARVKSADNLPGNIRWAVGGLGLLNHYTPAVEGFCKLTANGKTEDFSDVLRQTNHSMLGYKGGYYYLVYCANMTAAQVNTFAGKLGLEYAIMLDGGHVAGINGAEDFAKVNLNAKQYYMIQGETVK